MSVRVPLLLAALVLAAVLAGCSQNPPPPPSPDYGPGFHATAWDAHGLPVPLLLCQDAQKSNVSSGCNFDMTPTPLRQGNEVTIAVNPQDPKNVVGGAKDYNPTDAGQCVWDGIYVTHDGARTRIKDRSLDGSPWRLLSDPSSAKPQYTSQFWCTTDPVAYFSADGKSFYYLAMAYQADPVTGSKTCNGICEMPDEACALPQDPCAAAPIAPTGSLNDWAFNRATQVVCKSSNNGDSFDLCSPVFEGGSYPYMFNDKGWIAASNDGVIHVMWLASLLGGNLYFRSTDGGQTFQGPTVMSNGPDAVASDAGQGSFVEVGPAKEVYAAWTPQDATTGTIKLRSSADEGASWGPTQDVLTYHLADMPGLSSRDRRGGFPAMAVDRGADSPLGNSIYFAFQDSCQGAVWSASCAASNPSTNVTAGKGENRGNIYVVASHDGGKTWGTPVRVNDDADANGTALPDNFQFMPAVSVSPGGVVDVQWFDTREKGTAATTPGQAIAGGSIAAGKPHLRVDQYYSYSLDGGKTWSRNLRIRDANDTGWDPEISLHQNGKVFIGDYQGIDSSWQAAHPVFPDTRDGKYVKVYTATILRPMFANGWDPAKKAQAEAFIAQHPLT
ncbi:MAG: sialidase family protein [Thermoplasmatota archaeon]